MKLEELMNVLTDGTKVFLIDNEGFVTPVDDKDGIPAFLMDCEVTDVTAKGKVVEIGLDFYDFPKSIDVLRDKLESIYEALGDDYRCDSMSEAEDLLKQKLIDVRADLNQIISNLDLGKAWSCGIEY